MTKEVVRSYHRFTSSAVCVMFVATFICVAPRRASSLLQRMQFLSPATALFPSCQKTSISCFFSEAGIADGLVMHPESLVNHRLRRKTRRLPWRFASSSSLFDGSAESESGASVALLLEDLNPSQRSAVVQPRHSLVRVISGPGSGKTRVLTSRVAHLLLLEDTLRRERQQVDSPPREGEWVSGGILAVTFTRKAAGEMEERVRAMVGDDPARMSKVTLGTFHSICAKVLRWNGDLIGSLPLVQREASSLLLNATANNLDGSYVIVDEAEQFRIIKSCLDEAGISLVDSNIKPMTILSLLSEYKDGIAQNEEGENPFEKKKPGSSGPALSKAKKIVVTLYPLYREYLLRHNCLDFDDLIYYCRDLLLHHPDIRERLHRKWNHVLVDEFQDTSRSQLDLVKLWTSRSLMVVGDADQSIYSWRGAYVNSLSDFDKEFRAFGDVVTVFLMENYRSTSNIIMAAQKVISHRDNPDRATGADRLRQNMKPTRGKGPSPRVMRFQDDEDEARSIVNAVKDARILGNYTVDHTVAFIYRTNRQSRALEEACVRANLPYVIFGSATSFYKRAEIKDCLCYLRFLLNGNDRLAMVRTMTVSRRGIGEKTISEFESYCEGVTAYLDGQSRKGWTALDVLISMAAPQSSSLDLDFPSPLDYMSKRSANALTEFASAMRDLRRLAQRDSVEAVLHAVVERMEILQLLDRTSKSTSEFEERKQNVEELQKATRRYTDLGPCLVANEGADDEEGDSKELDAMDCPLRSFLDDVALVTDLAERSADERFVVNLMTIHASKGKEFDTVYVVGNEDGTLPSSQAIQEGEGSDELEEERRLCYVAMTRAKTELYLTWRQVVSVFTGQGIRQESRRRSRFLNILAGDRGKGNEKKEVYENPRPWLGSTGKSNERRYSRNAGAGAGRYSTPRQYGPPQAFKPYVVPSNPFSGELEGTTSVYGSGRRQPKQQRTPRQRRDAEEAVALYFPAGTIVIHRARGRGVVIPRPSRDADPELVYVKFFESGTLGQFSPYSDDLFPHSRSRRDRD